MKILVKLNKQLERMAEVFEVDKFCLQENIQNEIMFHMTEMEVGTREIFSNFFDEEQLFEIADRINVNGNPLSIAGFLEDLTFQIW